jgi:hypothetical protein
MAGIWTLTALLLLTGYEATPTEKPAFQQVRSTDVGLLGMLREGYRRSETVRVLIDRIEHSDVIVYIEPGHCAFGHVDACVLPFLKRTGGSRYLRIAVNTSLPRNRLLAILAHELQHAREISESPGVVDATTMRGLYRRIGVQSCGEANADCYETAEAQAVARAASEELMRTR